MISTADPHFHKGMALVLTEIWNAIEHAKRDCGSEKLAAVRYGWSRSFLKRVLAIPPVETRKAAPLLVLSPREIAGMSWVKTQKHAISRLVESCAA